MILVIVGLPFCCDISCLLNCFKNKGIKNIFSECAVEPFNKCILNRLTWLNVLDENVFTLTELYKSCSGKLRPIVHPDFLWLTSPFNYVTKLPYNSLRRK